MITFFPGPSRVYPEVKAYLAEAFESGILSASHRSEGFNQLSEETILLLKEKLKIPSDYTVLYTSSATESWEIIPQSLTKSSSIHFYSGSFGEKWFEYAKKLKSEVQGFSFLPNDDMENLLGKVASKHEIICLTHNETSNASALPDPTLKSIRETFPAHLIAYDITSSMAGFPLDFNLGHIWFGSVQKCFGLPAGLGLLVLSPKAITSAKEIQEKSHYNSLLTMLSHMEKFQTTCTPNVLGIFLLNRVLKNMPGIDQIASKLMERAKVYYNWLDESKLFQPLVHNLKNRSLTVIGVQAETSIIAEAKSEAKKAGILLGSGYGAWKESTFRIANFPALQPDEMDALMTFLTDFEKRKS